MSNEMIDFNHSIVDEFRSNQGRVGGMFEGVPILLLHTTGARSGASRISPLAYRTEGESWVVFGSYGGAPTNPAWFHNLVAHPDVEIEVGTETVPVTARVTEGDERDRIWAAQKRDVPAFAEYESKTDRQIPVILLERR